MFFLQKSVRTQPQRHAIARLDVRLHDTTVADLRSVVAILASRAVVVGRRVARPELCKPRAHRAGIVLLAESFRHLDHHLVTHDLHETLDAPGVVGHIRRRAPVC